MLITNILLCIYGYSVIISSKTSVYNALSHSEKGQIFGFASRGTLTRASAPDSNISPLENLIIVFQFKLVCFYHL